jgi:hypothetical protein
MRRARSALLALLSLFVTTTPAFCQIAPPPARSISLAGPRFGVTTLSPGVVDALHAEQINVRSLITQFGWQAERQFFASGSGTTVVSEWVGLLGGLDEGVVLPSVSWMVGIRTATGAEFGLGPNVTPAGVGLALAAGFTVRSGVMNIPMNVAVVPSQVGMRVSFLTGFTLRR